jgi:hypothetical protein
MKNREMLIRGGSQKLFWIGLTWLGICAGALAQGTPPPQPDFPPFNSVIEGFEQIASTTGKQPSLYGLYLNRKDNTLLGELPRDFASKKFFIAMTVSSGELYAGLQAGDRYVIGGNMGNDWPWLSQMFLSAPQGIWSPNLLSTGSSRTESCWMCPLSVTFPKVDL